MFDGLGGGAWALYDPGFFFVQCGQQLFDGILHPVGLEASEPGLDVAPAGKVEVVMFESQAVHGSRGQCHRALQHLELALADFKLDGFSYHYDQLLHEMNQAKGIFTADEWLEQSTKEQDVTKRPAMYAKVVEAAQAEKGVDHLIKLADALLSQQQFEPAAKLAQRALTLAPGDAHAQARAHLGEANRVWALEHSVENAQTVVREVQAATKLDDSIRPLIGPASGEAYAFLKARDVLTTEELERRAYYAASAGDYDKAIADTTRVLAASPEESLYRLNRLRDRAEYYRKQNHPDLLKAAADDVEAIAMLGRLIEAYPTNPDYWGQRGIMFASLHEPYAYVLAAVDLRKADELQPGNQMYKPLLHNATGDCLITAFHTSDDELAGSLAKAAATLVGDDSDLSLLHLYAEVLIRTKDYDGAVKVCDRLLALKGATIEDVSYANVLKCQAYFKQQDYDRVLAAYAQVDRNSVLFQDVKKYPRLIAGLRARAARSSDGESGVQTCPNCEGRGYVWHKTPDSPYFVQRGLVRSASPEGLWHEVTITSGWHSNPDTFEVCPRCGGAKVVER